jgi:dipeptidyl aminopeptidase/acylaminoacyl peptidase
MRTRQLSAAALMVVGASATMGVARAAPDPMGRAITDPASVVSADRAPAPPPPIAALFDARAGMGGAWSADGTSVIVSANASGRFNLWRYPADGGEAAILSPSDERQTGQIALPDGKTVVFESDKAGNERYDLYAVPLAGGAAVDLTDTPDISEDNAQASPDGRMLAFDRKPKTDAADNIAVMDLASRQVRVVTNEADSTYTWHLIAWTGDGASLIADRVNSIGTRGSAWRIDVASGRAQELTPPDATGGAGDVLTLASDISPDGHYLAVTSNRGHEQTQAALFEIATHRFVWLAPTPWEQVTGSFSPDGRTLAYRTNADGRTSISLYDVAGGVSRPVALPPGVNGEGGAGRTAFSPDSKRLLVSHAASNTPPDYWIYDVASGAARRLTHFGPASFDAASLPASQLVHYRSADGTVISAFLWIPDGLKRDASAPGVVLPHGGPTGQTTDTFSRVAIALASRGYVAIAPNPRGSTGYGKAFQAMNIKDLGGGDLVDEVAATKFLVATGYVSPKKIGITGGSYGGYMTLMAIGKTPAVWSAAVEQFGIIDWKTMLQHEDPRLQEYEKSLLGDPVKDAQVYADDSPITFIRHETAPLLVLQGDNDIRVPKEEAEQVVAILKAEGRTVDAHYYPNEGHGFVKRENQIDALERTIAWFDQYLKGAK